MSDKSSSFFISSPLEVLVNRTEDSPVGARSQAFLGMIGLEPALIHTARTTLQAIDGGDLEHFDHERWDQSLLQGLGSQGRSAHLLPPRMAFEF
jgi:hypothetical protein